MGQEPRLSYLYKDTCAHAAEGGHVEVLHWLRSQGCTWDEQTCAYALEGGHLEVLQWLGSQGCPSWIEGGTLLGSVVVGQKPRSSLG